jgi:hypothetical protein
LYTVTLGKSIATSMPFSFSLQCLKALREYLSTSPHFCYDLNYATTPGNMLDHSESNQIPGSSGPSTESGRDTGELVVDKILSELDECGLAGDRKTIDFPVKSRGKVSILYPGRLESAVWPGPHALTTRVKRCEPAHTGFRRCEPAHTRNIRLSSGVALVTRKKYRFCTRAASRRFRDDFTSKKCPRCSLGHTH